LLDEVDTPDTEVFLQLPKEPAVRPAAFSFNSEGRLLTLKQEARALRPFHLQTKDELTQQHSQSSCTRLSSRPDEPGSELTRLDQTANGGQFPDTSSWNSRGCVWRVPWSYL